MNKNLLFILMLIPQIVFGQNTSQTNENLIGYWEGAFVKSNSYQKIEIEFSEVNGKIFSLQIMDEWHPTFGEFQVPVEVDSTGLISFGTGYGKAELRLDSENLEVIGYLVGFNPTISLHLKKVPNKPTPNYTIEKVSIKSEEIELNGHLHLPKINPTKSAIILVGGRGCEADETVYNLYAKFLREYGIAVLAYQKRGTGSSTGNCDLATIQDLAEDLKSVKSFLANHKMEFEQIGVLGISAGGWTMTKAEENTSFDFMISIVGPSTSVKDQQLQSANYGADFYQLETKAKQNLIQYTNLLFDVKQSKEGFDTLKSLLEKAENEGWNQLLESTDIPKSGDEINNLWVKRHNYDPKKVLENYNKPFLAIYGQRDWIVPPKENTKLLRKYFQNRQELLTTITAFNAEHGMEMEGKWIDLGQNQSYWHFYRISPEVRITIVDFLRKHDLIK